MLKSLLQFGDCHFNALNNVSGNKYSYNYNFENLFLC